MLENIIRPIVESHGLRLWSCEVQEQGRQTSLRVMIDGAGLEDCANLSREISAVLDVEDPFQGAYQLEVSSPGVHRKLSTLAHFAQYIGKEIKVKWRSTSGEYQNSIATITEVKGDQIFLTITGEQVEIALGDIQKASVC